MAKDKGYTQQLGTDELKNLTEEYHLETLEQISVILNVINEKLYEHIEPYVTSEEMDSVRHNISKLGKYIKGHKTKEEPTWRIKGEQQNLPQDVQDILNDVCSTHENIKGQTLQEVLDDCTKTVKNYDKNYYSRGHFRPPLTVKDQKELHNEDKIIFVVEDNLLFWAENNFDEGFLTSINAYDYPDSILKHCEVIPMSICGIDGKEFEKDTRVIYTDKTTVKVINGEEVEILQGHLKGNGSEILYS